MVKKRINLKRIIALVVICVLAVFLAYLRFSPAKSVSVPQGAHAGDLTLERGTYVSGGRTYVADIGRLIVPENHEVAGSRPIALPIIRIPARVDGPAEPVFFLNSGPGISNMNFAHVRQIADNRDVVILGYRGVDGSSVLNSPEVESALKQSKDFLDEESLRLYSEAFAATAGRLQKEGVDISGYTGSQQVDDLETARVALGYDRINLISQSAGTRTAIIYSWRYPKSIARSIMIGVNPPGHFLYDPRTNDEQLSHYAELLSRDEKYSRQTGNLAASMRSTSANMPDRWLFLPIKKGNVKVASVFGITETTPEDAPLNSPAVIQSWLSAEAGDSSGFWFMSFISDMVFPKAFVWGEFAAVGNADRQFAADYYSGGGDPGSILGDPGTAFLWGGGGLAKAWPANPFEDKYKSVQSSDVETLLIGGSLDFQTPAKIAANELLPFLPNGHQVVLAEFGHTDDFWSYQPEAGAHLINTFFDQGQVDSSRYTYQKMNFEPTLPFNALAKGMVGTMIGFAVLAALSLLWMWRRVNKRGAFGPAGAAWSRSLYLLILGLGGWFLAVLIVMTFWTTISLDNMLMAVLSIGLPTGLGIYWSWVHKEWPSRIKNQGFGVIMVCAFLGAWMGFNATSGLLSLITSIVGAAIFSNLMIILMDILNDRSRRNSDI